MKNIIVPLDFSENSINGLDLAVMIANKLGANLQMVYVQKKSKDYSPGNFEGEHHWAVEKFEHILKEYKDRIYSNVKLSYIIKFGKIFNEIVNQSHAFEHSFIVCSTHGASGFEEFFIGSNAFKIVSYTYDPVFTIRGNNVPLNFNKILMPIDISADSRQKVPFTADLAQKYGAEIHVLGVSSTTKDDVRKKLDSYTKQVAEYLAERNIIFKTDIQMGSNITDLTIDYSKHIQAKLVSIMSEQTSNLSNFLLGNYAQQMLNKSTIPVLTITPRELHINSGFRTQG